MMMGLSGCGTTTFTKTVSSTDTINSQNAYVYGSFKLDWLDAPDLDLKMGAYPSIGLRFVCDKGQVFQLGMSPLKPDQVVQVPLDQCSLKSFLFTNGLSGRIEREKPYTGDAMQKIDFSPGMMFYLGDFVGEVEYVRSGNLFTRRYKLLSHRDAYIETTDRMLKSNLSLNRLKTFNVAKNNNLTVFENKGAELQTCTICN
jgi:hypothetical protein